MEEERRLAEERDKWVMRETPQPLCCSVPWMPSSKVGLGVAAEYTTDEMAEGSDDKKRLEKAERAVELKAAKRRKKRDGGVSSGFGPGICLYCTALTCNIDSTHIIGYI